MMQQQDTQHTKTEMVARREQVAALYLRGMSQASIGEQLSVNQATVSRDLTELRKEWLERSINHIDQKKAIELAKLDRLEVTYWDAWERSQRNAETEITEQIGERKKIKVKGEDGKEEQQESVVPERIKKSRRVEGQSGNPAFLDGVLKCIDRRCAILGLDAPKKLDAKLDISAVVDWDDHADPTSNN